MKNITAVPQKEKITSRIRSVGNSKGVILNNHLLKIAGIDIENNISIEAENGLITISQARSEVDTALKNWDKQFAKAKKAGHKPEKDLFNGLVNDFDKTEW